MANLFSHKINWSNRVTIQSYTVVPAPRNPSRSDRFLLLPALQGHVRARGRAYSGAGQGHARHARTGRKGICGARGTAGAVVAVRAAAHRGRSQVPCRRCGLDALPDDHLHESGRWTVRPRSNMIWDRVKKRIAAESPASVATAQTASHKKRERRQQTQGTSARTVKRSAARMRARLKVGSATL